jgi:hypothetical protein
MCSISRITVCCSVAVLIVAISLPGCQRAFPVELHGSIRSSADGAPLRGVRVELLRGVNPVYSEPDGSFVFKFKDDWLPGEKWQLSLSQEDFNDETVMMRMSNGPDTRGTTQVFVFVYMRPKG